MRRRILTLGVIATAVASAGTVAFVSASASSGEADTPIKHVVVIMQENHSFDNVLGKLCVDDKRCDGSLVGTLHTGARIALHRSPNYVPYVDHTVKAQIKAVDGGKMDGFDTLGTCNALTHYRCFAYYDETQIPNLAHLARQFALSDRSFSPGSAPSWGGHLAMVMPDNGWRNGWGAPYQFDGFIGDNPSHISGAPTPGPGWGCDSKRDDQWKASPTASPIWQPSCIPDPAGNGPYRASHVAHVDTVLDSMDAANVSWKIYGTTNKADSSYIWSVCPSFAQCLEHQRSDFVSRGSLRTDALAGALPAVSFVVPNNAVSQHNNDYMTQGDNTIGADVSAIMRGPDWQSTAIFITYDDCGCFYDHVSPNTPVTGWGIRVPMVIVSPFAKPGFTDSTPTSSTGGILAFIEHTFGLPAIANEGSLYDFSNSFTFSSGTTTTVSQSTTSTTDTTTSTTDTTTSTTDTTTSTVPDTSVATTDTTDSTTTTTDPNATFPFNTPGPTLAPNAVSSSDPT
jgi:phospholipase C